MPTEMSPLPCWPIAAASRIRVKPRDDATSFCRLFVNRATGAIELVPCDDGEGSRVDERVDEDTYRATSEDGDRAVADSFHPDDVVGAHLSLECEAAGAPAPRAASSSVVVHAYPQAGRGRPREARHRRYELDPRCCEDFADARRVVRAIQVLAGLGHVGGPRPPKCLVVLNPFSGGGGAEDVYQTIVKPMLEEAGLEHDAVVTQAAGHARERMRRDPAGKAGERGDIAEYDAVVAMGGDGILFEILQGIRARPDGEALMAALTFGLVPCGTYNGLAKSLAHWGGDDHGPVSAAFRVAKGRARPLDVAAYAVRPAAGGPPRACASCLSFSWGLVADCDYESEVLRWLGPLRSDVWAVYRGLLNRRRYPARLSHLPADRVGAAGVEMPRAGEPLPEGWVTEEDDYVIFWACNTSHAGENIFTCPMAKMVRALRVPECWTALF